MVPVGLNLDLALLGPALNYFPGPFLCIDPAPDQNRDARRGLKESVKRPEAIAIGPRPVERRGRNPAAAKPPDPAGKFGNPVVAFFRARLFRGSHL